MGGYRCSKRFEQSFGSILRSRLGMGAGYQHGWQGARGLEWDLASSSGYKGWVLRWAHGTEVYRWGTYWSGSYGQGGTGLG